MLKKLAIRQNWENQQMKLTFSGYKQNYSQSKTTLDTNYATIPSLIPKMSERPINCMSLG